MDKLTLTTYKDGTKAWRRNKSDSPSQLHREDGPAIEYSNGGKEWHLNGHLHREDGPALEEPNGNKAWYLNGLLHREDGPAIECSNGRKEWYHHGKLHREDGPALEYSDGTKAWWHHGEQIFWKNVLPKLHQPSYEPTQLEQTMIEHHLNHG